MKELIWRDIFDRTTCVDIGAYPDSLPFITDMSEPLAVLLRPKSFASFVGAMFWLDAVNERYGADRPHRLVLPFVPGARQDRLNQTGDQLFTAKSVAKMINDRKIEQVVVLDPHSEVISGMIDRCRVIKPRGLIKAPVGKYAAVISPDAGAEKRALQVATSMGVPLIHAWKTRSVKDGSITGFGCEPIALPTGSRLLVVDDICDGGRTFIGLAEAVNQRRPYDTAPPFDLHLYVTHGIFSQGTTELRKHYSHIYCTDSILDDRDLGVIRINVCEGLMR